ncbi:hypothetical protein [Pontibacter sp. HSC-36F09]|uniref:hypothetical protein n=1 Tax=Pontibacter sp. HSC-36F09 TaxID=2910966 RepID=UPI00209DC914|nr:hypothetical protein [Pontibacter sp. HSC-36F09]MCP2043621.1 hypothetical protein [Pontibacter sp. HSC-36F09]
MELLYWKQENLTARKYTVRDENSLVGELAFRGWTSNDADFSSARINLYFQRQGWLEHDLTIHFKDEVIGMSKSSGFGKTTTTLVTGEQFTFQGKTLNSSRDILDKTGQTLVRFEQGNFSIASGQISIGRDIPELTKLLLVATGLYLKHLGQ